MRVDSILSLGLERAALVSSGERTVCGAIIRQGDCVVLERKQTGYRPPQVIAQNRGELRQALGRTLQDHGLPVRLGPAYSVFDEGSTKFSYVLAMTDVHCANAFETHCISDIHTLSFASPSIAKMMARFAQAGIADAVYR